MQRIYKKMFKIFAFIILLFVVILLAVYINHRIRLDKEQELLVPLGEMISVDGNNMSVYKEGSGDKTLVFLSGGGTCSPILDFKSLYSLLSDEYQIVVVEKFGYGYSDVVDRDRDIDSILDDTRKSLEMAGIKGPYVLCPHSMSGLEALYWANKYPDEVTAIIGLDMAVPQYYENMKINIPLMKVSSFVANIGVTRLIPGISESEAIKHGTLTEYEKDIYKAIFYRRTATSTMIQEMEYIKNNAKIVEEMGVPTVPMCLFVSNGSGGTGFDEETWRQIPKKYITKVDDAKIIEFNCPHYVQDYEYATIAEEIKLYLSGK